MKNEKLVVLVITLFAVITFLLSYFLIDPVLHYHNQQIAWQSGVLFFDHFLSFPGGIGEYVALFISQWFFYKWAGSLIISLTGLLISLFLFSIVRLRYTNYKFVLLLLPVPQLLTLVLLFDYRYHFSVTFNLLIISGALFIFSVLYKKSKVLGYIVILITGIILYIVCGGGYFLIFMMSAAIIILEKPYQKSVLKIFLIAVTAGIIPYLAYKYFFLVSLKYAYLKSVPDVAVMLRYSKPLIFQVALAAIPAILLIVKGSTYFGIQKASVQVQNKKYANSNAQGKPQLKGIQLVSIVLQLIILMAVSTLLIINKYNPAEKLKVEIDYHAYQQNWNKVIELSDELDEYDRMVNFHFNRALLNTGQVLDRIFEYQQKLGTLALFLDVPFTAEITLPNSDLYFDLGNIDESQRYAFESETLMKNSPRVLKRLILNCIIMDKMEAALTYINILESNPLERNWAEKYRKLVENSQLAAEDDLIQQKRNELSKAEGMLVTPPLKLLQQLEKNPQNIKAIEYLIAIDLMEHDLASLKEDIKYLTQLNYSKLPLSVEEAIILFLSQNKQSEFLNSFRISSSTVNRFREFAKLSKESKGDREKAKIATKAFEKTYWYYALFVSPRVTNLKLETTPVDTNY